MGGTSLSLIIVDYMLNYQLNITPDYQESMMGVLGGCFRVIPVITIFITCKVILEEISLSTVTEKIIEIVASCVFGVYLIEEPIREHAYFVYNNMCEHMSPFIAIGLYTLLVFLIALFIVWILKRIPWISKLI